MLVALIDMREMQGFGIQGYLVYSRDRRQDAIFMGVHY